MRTAPSDAPRGHCECLLFALGAYVAASAVRTQQLGLPLCSEPWLPGGEQCKPPVNKRKGDLGTETGKQGTMRELQRIQGTGIDTVLSVECCMPHASPTVHTCQMHTVGSFANLHPIVPRALWTAQGALYTLH